MDMILTFDTPVRPPEDLVAEGMWRMAAGNRCPECWDELPADRRMVAHLAINAVRGWMAGFREPL
jgi:hypothetical protein